MTARNHHFLPQGYLRGFDADQSRRRRVQVFDLEGRKSFPTNVRNIAAERNFNRIDVKGLAPDALENGLGAQEQLFSTAIDRIAASSTLEAEALGTVLYWVGLFYLRNPRVRALMTSVLDDTVKRIMRLSVETPEAHAKTMERIGVPPERAASGYSTVKRFVEQGNYRIEMPREDHIAREFRDAERMVPLLNARTWMLIHAGAHTGGFVTSDNPTPLVWNKRELDTPATPPDLMMASTSLVFPLTKDFCLVGMMEGQAVLIEATLDAVARLNTAIVRFADRQIYAPHDKFVFFDKDEAARFGHDLLTFPAKPGHVRKRAR